ncbi:lipopolysaccharide export system permease protein [Shimia gijangensis]|uniref:Lipopolysaccharide export system permease protein n=1 Tax=Shimia gijangensis TaxID=1470563 RepID=A0A1M6HDA2_9RHOB|nr:LPS export ABC transporter permease LptG [Shimia gijangensis]SHJ20185.1 lipopolysaccharide export system permease protein [Shimia gijangensis]
MIIHLYFARKFLFIFMGLQAVFLALLALVDMMEQFRRFNVDEIGFSNILQLTLLKAPEGLYQILPLVVILSTITLFLGLARSSELVVVRGSGRSALMSLVSPVCVALVIGLLAVSTFNPIVAATTERYHALTEKFRSGGKSALSLSAEGLWLRQGGATGQAVIHAVSANPDATVFFDVSITTYERGGGPVRRVEAQSAKLLDGAWELREATEWSLIAGTNPEETAQHHDVLKLDSTLTHDRIRDSFGKPSVVSVWDLPQFIRELEEAGFSARRHKVWLMMELAQPLFLCAMVLIASAFTMRHTRFGRTGIAVLGAVLMGFALYYVRNFAQILGENGEIPAALAAWAPPIASVMLALGLLLHMEDG